jgi:hypothetical protein
MYLYLFPRQHRRAKMANAGSFALVVVEGSSLGYCLVAERKVTFARDLPNRSCGLLILSRRCLLRGDGVSLESWSRKRNADLSYVITIQQDAAFLVDCSRQARQQKGRLYVCIYSGMRKRHQRVRLKGRFNNCHKG